MAVNCMQDEMHNNCTAAIHRVGLSPESACPLVSG